MLNMFELLLPLILIALISLPLVNVFRGKKSVSVAKRRTSASSLQSYWEQCSSVLRRLMLQVLMMSQ